jgi:hypothetical protein
LEREEEEMRMEAQVKKSNPIKFTDYDAFMDEKP